MNRSKKVKVSQLVSLYSVIPLLSAFGLNMLIYSGTMKLCASWKHYDFTTAFDLKVPVIPGFIYIYFGCYLFWIANYILIGRLGKEHFYRFITADILSRIVCGLFYILLPTTNIALRQAVVFNDTSWSEKLLQFLYNIDQPTNLFPSIHCLVSWFCYIGIRGHKKVPQWYQNFSGILALAVCVSTQVTKQHYIVDVFGGIILAEILYFITAHTNIYQPVQNFFEKINSRILTVRS
jgi:membrane-associated phospholipid phosphatase